MFLKDIIETTKLFFIIYIFFHLFLVIPFNRIFTALSHIDFTILHNFFSSTDSRVISTVISVVGISLLIKPSIRVGFTNMILNFGGGLISAGPYILIGVICFIVYLLVEQLIDYGRPILHTITTTIESIVTTMEHVLHPAINMVSTTISSVATTVTGVETTIQHAITPVINAISNIINNTISPAITTVQGIVQSVKNWVDDF